MYTRRLKKIVRIINHQLMVERRSAAYSQRHNNGKTDASFDGVHEWSENYLLNGYPSNGRGLLW